MEKINKTENIKEYRRKYYLDNINYYKNYKAQNQEKIKEYMKKYYEKNNPNEKISCECGGQYSKAAKTKHLQTNKHFRYEHKKLVDSLKLDSPIDSLTSSDDELLIITQN